MGKIETWEVVSRTEDALTVLYKRRIFHEEQFPLSTDPTKKEELTKDGLDKETRTVLNKLSQLNKRIRRDYHFETSNSLREDRQPPEKPKTKTRKTKPRQKERREKSEDMKTMYETTTDSARTNSTDSKLEKKNSQPDWIKDSGMIVRKQKKNGKTSEPCDHRGIPLSDPMAMTPYPGACSVAQREKARKMLKDIAKKMHEEDLKKEKERNQKEKKTNEKSEAKSSEQRKEKSSKSSKSSKSGKKTKTSKTASKSASSSSLISNLSKSSNKKVGCDKCGSCQKCIHRCSQKHAAELKVTAGERDMFLKGIKRLRKKIMIPERSQRNNVQKSPFDVTQSESESCVASSSNSVSKGRKKSAE